VLVELTPALRQPLARDPASEGPGADDAPVAPPIRILGIVPSPLTFVTVAVVILLLEAVALVIARRRGQAISAH